MTQRTFTFVLAEKCSSESKFFMWSNLCSIVVIITQIWVARILVMKMKKILKRTAIQNLMLTLHFHFKGGKTYKVFEQTVFK